MLLERDRRDAAIMTLPFEAGAGIVFFRSAAACDFALAGIVTGVLAEQRGIDIVVLGAGGWNISLGGNDARKEYPNAGCYKANTGKSTHVALPGRRFLRTLNAGVLALAILALAISAGEEE
jgi:hypothetical protein